MSAQPEVHTPRLHLRPLRDADLAPLYAIQGDREAMRFTFCARTPQESEENLRGWAAQLETHGVAPWVAVLRDDDRVVGWGGLGVDPHEPGFGIEVGYFLHRDTWGRGLATELVGASLRHAFETLGLEWVGAFVRPENAASLRVLEKCGFQLLRYVPELERNQYEVRRAGWLAGGATERSRLHRDV